jgi:hypothetical protein
VAIPSPSSRNPAILKLCFIEAPDPIRAKCQNPINHALADRNTMRHKRLH